MKSGNLLNNFSHGNLDDPLRCVGEPLATNSLFQSIVIRANCHLGKRPAAKFSLEGERRVI